MLLSSYSARLNSVTFGGILHLAPLAEDRSAINFKKFFQCAKCHGYLNPMDDFQARPLL